MTKETVKDRNGCFLKGEENLLNVVEDREAEIDNGGCSGARDWSRE